MFGIPRRAEPADDPTEAVGGPVHHTAQLDPVAASAEADPWAPTAVIPLPGGGGPGSAGASAGASLPAVPAPLVSRRVAAEIGMYLGAGLVLVSIGSAVARGWAVWADPVRWATVALSAVALLAAGLFVRLPWARVPSDQRRRAVSALLTSGTAVAAGAVGAALPAGRAPSAGVGALAAATVVALLGTCAVARTPLSETGVLAALAWVVALLVPPGPPTWAGLVALGALWAAVGYRLARGRRSAVVTGAVLALAGGVGLASGPWAWPARAALAVVAVGALVMFLRGGANAWLALGAAAATALAAAVAGDVLGPALALLMGGLATMAVSWMALGRSSARRG